MSAVLKPTFYVVYIVFFNDFLKLFFCLAYLHPCKPLVSVVVSGLSYEL